MTFKIGDVVMLKSGSPLMVVVEPDEGLGIVSVQWWSYDKGDLKETEIVTAVLKLMETGTEPVKE